MFKIKEKFKSALRIDKAVLFVWKASPKTALISFMLVFIQGFLPLANLYLIKLIVDEAADSVKSGMYNLNEIIILICIAGFVQLFTYLCSHLASIISQYQSISVSDYVLKKIHEKSVTADLQYYENSKYFDSFHRAQHEGPYRPVKIVNGLTQILQNGISLAGIGFLLFTFHWAMSVILFLAVVPGVFVKIFFSRVKYNWDKNKTHKEREAAYLNWLITGYSTAKEIRLFDIGNFFVHKFFTLRSSLKNQEINISRKRAFYEFTAQIFSVSAIFSALGFIVFKAVSGAVSMGGLVMYYQAFQKGLAFFKGLLTALAELYEDNLFISNFYDFLELENKIKNVENPAAFPKVLKLGIEFKNVSFKYPDTNNYVLKNVSFDIEPQKTIALAGENGAGKSTILKLMCRLYDPTEGFILLDGIPLTKYDINDLRKNIGVLFQDFVHYHFTAKENIWLGNKNMSVNSLQIHKAAEKAGIDNVISSLPQQYSTVLGKMFANGCELSEGQWQKIALARAFAKDAPVILLDEPSSSMDADSEYEIFNKIRTLMKGKTCVIISHRFSTIRNAHKIIVLHKGKITEQGTHEKLINNNSLYSRWYKKQSVVNGCIS